MTQSLGDAIRTKRAAEREDERAQAEEQKFADACHMFVDGMSQRAVAKQLKIRPETVGKFHDRWEKKIGTVDELAEEPTGGIQ